MHHKNSQQLHLYYSYIHIFARHLLQIQYHSVGNQYNKRCVQEKPLKDFFQSQNLVTHCNHICIEYSYLYYLGVFVRITVGIVKNKRIGCRQKRPCGQSFFKANWAYCEESKVH